MRRTKCVVRRIEIRISGWQKCEWRIDSSTQWRLPFYNLQQSEVIENKIMKTIKSIRSYLGRRKPSNIHRIGNPREAVFLAKREISIQLEYWLAAYIYTVWKLREFTLTHFGKNFVKVTVLLKKLLNKWFDEIFFTESKFP